MRYSKYLICPECRGKVLLSNGIPVNAEVYRYGSLYCYGKYVGLLRERFIDYKFKKEMWLGRRFGELMYENFSIALSKNPPHVVSFVPINRQRMISRGFNQSREMAESLSVKLGVKCSDLLNCVRTNAVQSKLGRNGRITEINGRFEMKANSESISGKKVLLVDDIFTTGATLNECARILTECGAACVDGMVFATGRTDVE